MSSPMAEGEMTYANGDVYNGKWTRGKRHGEGEFTLANGDKYLGNWIGGEKHGEVHIPTQVAMFWLAYG